MKRLSDDFSRGFDRKAEFHGIDDIREAVMNVYIESLQKMIAGAANAPHVQPLFQKAGICVLFISEAETAAMKMGDGELQFMRVFAESRPDITIIGTDGALENLITGKNSLRALERDKELSVKCTFRNKLWLESVFLMSKHHSQHNYLSSVPRD